MFQDVHTDLLADKNNPRCKEGMHKDGPGALEKEAIRPGQTIANHMGFVALRSTAPFARKVLHVHRGARRSARELYGRSESGGPTQW